MAILGEPRVNVLELNLALDKSHSNERGPRNVAPLDELADGADPISGDDLRYRAVRKRGTIKRSVNLSIRHAAKMSDDRPNPDELLARVQEEESRAGGASCGFSLAMRPASARRTPCWPRRRRERAAGTDVVVGYVEPHGRPETEALLAGLESLPMLSVTYRGAALREFDLDAALARKPAVMLVDELAHTNAPGMRHPKRWQDVEELLEAGIDVWTTLNVQHIESLNDVIAQITGVAVKETLPDTVLERADEIELIDITPDKLMERLAAGKVYIPAQAERALKNFFQKGNLVALRELSLRQAASRVQRDVEVARQERAAGVPWVTSERLLVCVGPSPTNARIVRATKRLARSLGAEWLAVAVETGTERRRSADDQGADGPQPAPGRTAWRRNAHAGGPQRGRHAARLRPLAECHEDRRRQDGAAAVEAMDFRHDCRSAAGEERRHRCVCRVRRGRSGGSSHEWPDRGHASTGQNT